jgi:hypothetical protein
VTTRGVGGTGCSLTFALCSAPCSSPEQQMRLLSFKRVSWSLSRASRVEVFLRGGRKVTGRGLFLLSPNRTSFVSPGQR